MQDPARWDNDIAFPTYRIMDVRETFKRLAKMQQHSIKSRENLSHDPFERFFGSRLARIQIQRTALLTETELKILRPREEFREEEST